MALAHSVGECGRAGVQARGPIREAPQAHGRLGRVLRQAAEWREGRTDRRAQVMVRPWWQRRTRWDRRGPHEKRGRPKVLHTGKVIDPTQRALGNLLRDISEASEEIAAKNPRPQSQTDIADRLWQHKRRSYNSDRTLRRDVSRALAWTINMLKLTPPELWPKIFGIQPPSAMTKRAVLNKALEFLRMELARSRGALSSQ